MSWYDEFKAKGQSGYPVTKKFINELEEASQKEPFMITNGTDLFKRMTLLTAGYLDEVAHAGACSPHELLPLEVAEMLAESLGPSLEDELTQDKVDDLALQTVAGVLKDFVLCLGLSDLDSDGYPKW